MRLKVQLISAAALIMAAAGAAMAQDVNTKDNDGITPLMYAADRGLTDSVKALIAAGADVNAKNKSGEIPLYVAKSDEIKALLRAAGAKQ